MPIQVTVPDGPTLLLDHLTLDEAIALQDVVGQSWGDVNPYRSAKHAKAVLQVLMERSMGVEEAAKRAGAMTIEDALACFDLVEEDDLPSTFEDGLPSDPKVGTAPTGGSSLPGAPSE